MNRLALAVGLHLGLLLLAGPAEAQWRYTDATGATKVTQYKLHVPAPYRDGAEWIGPIGVGKPALSAEQIRAAQHWAAVQRIIAAEADLLRFKSVATPAPPRVDPGPGKPMATMCIAGELRTMTSPGSWKVVGGCGAGFSTDYATSAGFIVR